MKSLIAIDSILGGAAMNTETCLRLATGLAVLLSSALAPSTRVFAAQGALGVPQSATCMVREQQEGSRVSIVLPKTFADQMAKRGYVVADCGLAFTSKSGIEAWRNSICDLASISTEAVQLSYRETLGERPAVLCALAEAVIGPWAKPGQFAPN